MFRTVWVTFKNILTFSSLPAIELCTVREQIDAQSRQSSRRGDFGNLGSPCKAAGPCPGPGPLLSPGGERASLRQRCPGAAAAGPGCLSGTTEPRWALCDSDFKQDRDTILTADVTLPQTFFLYPVFSKGTFYMWVLMHMYVDAYVIHMYLSTW